MATLEDLGVSAFINILSAFVFLLLFAVLRIQPINDRVYFPKLYLAHKRTHDHSSRSAVRRFVNLDVCTYITFLSWVPGALRVTEPELIAHAGLDSAVYLRIYTLGYDVDSPAAAAVLLLQEFTILLPFHCRTFSSSTADRSRCYQFTFQVKQCQ
jgi:hypothetical protein